MRQYLNPNGLFPEGKPWLVNPGPFDIRPDKKLWAVEKDGWRYALFGTQMEAVFYCLGAGRGYIIHETFEDEPLGVGA